MPTSQLTLSPLKLFLVKEKYIVSKPKKHFFWDGKPKITKQNSDLKFKNGQISKKDEIWLLMLGDF